MDIHPTDIIINIINILVLFVLLRVILWKPVHKFTSARAESIREAVDGAEQAKQEALALKDEYKKSIDGLEAEGRVLLRESHIKAEEEAKSIVAEAKEQAQTIIADARVKIEGEKSVAVARARDEVAQLATNMAAHILKRAVTAADSAAAAEDFFNESR